MTRYDWRPWPFPASGEKYAAVEDGWPAIAALKYELGGWWLEIDDLLHSPVMVSLNVVTKDDAFAQADQVVEYWVTAERVVDEVQRRVHGGE